MLSETQKKLTTYLHRYNLPFKIIILSKNEQFISTFPVPDLHDAILTYTSETVIVHTHYAFNST